MNIACITLSEAGAAIISQLCKHVAQPEFSCADVYLHESVEAKWNGERFSRVVELTQNIFNRYRGMVFVAPCGVVVRAIAPCVKHKTTDPAVVVVDNAARYAISLLSGHEGGANELTIRVSNIIGAESVITTSSEAVKRLIVGIGCRRNTSSEKIVDAIRAALARINAEIDDVRLIATADVKADEAGILSAAKLLNIPLRIISSDEIKLAKVSFSQSSFVESKIGLPAVAEPAALIAGRRTRLRLPRTSFQGITVAIAQEDCMWLA